MSSDTFQEQRLHPAGIAVMGLRALRDSALPLILVALINATRGGLQATDLLTTLPLLVIGALLAAGAGAVQWATTAVTLSPEALSLRQGLFAKNETTVPLERVQGLDEVAGPLQRSFGVVGVDVQTAGGGAGGEIRLPAVDPEMLGMLRRAVAARRGEDAAAERPSGPRWRLSRGRLLAAAVTSGSFGVLLPVLAFLPQLFDELFLAGEDDPGAGALLGIAPDSATEWLTAAAVVLAAAWLLSALGVIVAFAGFDVERAEDRLLIRRGLLQRRVATVPVARVQAVRVVEGVLRQPFGLASLRVEVAGYAQEAAAAQTLLPLLHTREVPSLLAELLPEIPHDAGPFRPAPRRALRRYVAAPALVALAAAGGSGLAAGTALPLLALVPAAAYGALRHRAAGCALRDGGIAVRFRRLARTTLIGPMRLTQEHSVRQTPLQRRAGLADFEIRLGAGGDGRVRHLEAGDAWSAFAAATRAA